MCEIHQAHFVIKGFTYPGRICVIRYPLIDITSIILINTASASQPCNTCNTSLIILIANVYMLIYLPL